MSNRTLLSYFRNRAVPGNGERGRSRREMRSYGISIGIAAIASLLFGWLHPYLTLGVVPFTEIFVFGSIPSAVVACMTLLFLTLSRHRFIAIRNILIAMPVFILCLAPSIPRVEKEKAVARRQAEQFIRNLIPAIVEYRSTHGSFPDELSMILPDSVDMPRYIRIRNTYYSTGTNFSFFVVDAPGWPICSGMMAYRHASTNWDSCACW